MKHSEKKRWDIDFDVIADDSNLCCAEVIGYVRKLYKAISANGNACGVKPWIGDEFFHRIEIWGDNGGDNNALIALVAEMAQAGCYVDDWRDYPNG